MTLIVKKDSGINSWNDMAGKTLGGAAGEAELMEAEAHLKELGVAVKESLGFPGGLEARQALLNGQVDAVAGDSAELLYYINSAPEAAALALVAGDPISIVPSGTVLRNQNTALIAAINCEIKNQLADGTMAALAKQWFGSSQSVDNLLKLGGN